MNTQFPGGYHYLNVSKPQPPIDLETAMMDANYGRELVTEDKDAGYFRCFVFLISTKVHFTS